MARGAAAVASLAILTGCGSNGGDTDPASNNSRPTFSGEAVKDTVDYNDAVYTASDGEEVGLAYSDIGDDVAYDENLNIYRRNSDTGEFEISPKNDSSVNQTPDNSETTLDVETPDNDSVPAESLTTNKPTADASSETGTESSEFNPASHSSESPETLAHLSNAQHAAVANAVVQEFGPSTSVGTREEYDSAMRDAALTDSFEDILNAHNFGLEFTLTSLANSEGEKLNAAYNMSKGMFAELPGGPQEMQTTMFDFLDQGNMVTYTDMRSYQIRHVEGTPIYDAACTLPGFESCVMGTVESDREIGEAGEGPEYMSVVFGAVVEDGKTYWQYIEDSPSDDEHQYASKGSERKIDN